MDLENKLENDRNEIIEILGDTGRLKAKIDSTDAFSIHLINRLFIAIENTLGCVTLAEKNLALPLVIVFRSIFESLITVYWASQKLENASNLLAEEERREISRIIRKNLKNGRAEIYNNGEIETDTILKHPKMQDAKRYTGFETMAKEANIHNIYDSIYPITSMYAHGTATELISRNRFDEKLSPSICTFENAAICCLKSIHLISINHIREKRKTNKDELESILKINLFN